MDIKRKKKEKRIQLFGGLIGICVAVVSLFYFFHTEKAEAEKRMVEIVNYVKVQCSTYTHDNESSESKSLLRAIESARQMSTNIDMEIPPFPLSTENPWCSAFWTALPST